MGKLVAQNKWLFIGAALCVLISVVIDYLTPLLLAETLDYYLSGQPSTMPAFVNRWVDSWGGPNFMARNLWIVGLALVGLNIVGGAINFFLRLLHVFSSPPGRCGGQIPPPARSGC